MCKKRVWTIILGLAVIFAVLSIVFWNLQKSSSKEESKVYAAPGIATTCRETDDGANPYEKGRVYVGPWWSLLSGKTYVDTCKNAYSLTEYYCKLGYVEFKEFNSDSDLPCDYCHNGACAIPPP